MSTQASHPSHSRESLAPKRKRTPHVPRRVGSALLRTADRYPIPAAIAGVAIVLAAGHGIDNIKHARHPFGMTGEANPKAQKVAYKKLDTVEGKRIVLRAGSTLRYTPQEITGNDAHKSNVAATVPEGKEFELTLPVSRGLQGSWKATKLPGTEGPMTATNTVYVNVGKLEGQINAKGNSYAATYKLGENAPASAPFEPNGLNQQGVATLHDAGYTERHMVQKLG